MTLTDWIIISLFVIGQITGLVSLYISMRLKIKELEMKMESLKENLINTNTLFHIHEEQNERMFEKFEKKMDAVYNSVNEIKALIIKSLQDAKDK